MQNVPKNIPMTGFDKSVELAGLLVILMLWALTIFSYFNLQEIIPIHYNASGRVTKWGQKTTLLFFPITATVIFVGLTILNRYPQHFNTINWKSENASLQLKYAMRMLRILKLSIGLAFSLVVLFTYFVLDGQLSPMGPWLLPVILAVILIPVGYYLIKMLRLN